MENNYYHRGNGECVRQKMHCPYRNDKYYTRCDKDDCNCLFLSEADAYCDPTRPVGWLHGVREVYQVKSHTTSDWKDFGNNEFWHDWTPANRRIWIEPVAERENYEQEAQGLYRISDIASDLWKSRIVAVRAAHIKARQMAEQEIRELRATVDKLREGLGELFEQYKLECKNYADSHGVNFEEWVDDLPTYQKCKQLLAETDKQNTRK